MYEEGKKWLEDNKFEYTDGEWTKSLDITAVSRADFERFKKEGKEYKGEALQTLALAVSWVTLGNGLSGWRCEITGGRGDISFGQGAQGAHAYETPQTAIRVAAALLFRELWECVRQTAKLARIKVAYENEEA